MNIDQRLHRAAHDLRELEIDVPPLPDDTSSHGGATLRRLGAPVATAMLLAVAAIGAIAELGPADRTGGQAAIEDAVTTEATSDSDAHRERPLSAREEVALIAALNRPPALDAPDGELDRGIPPSVI